jgi:hypothetical protein
MGVLGTVLVLRRRHLIKAVFLAVGVWACDPGRDGIAAGSPSVAQQGDKPMDPFVEVHNLESPGAFEVVNHGGVVDLAWEVGVEQASDGEWRRVMVEQFELVERCGQPKGSPCRTLEKDAVVRPVPWTGYSCTSQCNEACRANVYYGQGRFRFVVWDCSKQHRFEGPPFDLPPDPS